MLEEMLKNMEALLTKIVLVIISSEISSFEHFIGYSKRRNSEDFELLFESRYA